MHLATGPVSWGVDFADAPGNPPWTTVLDGIASTGLRWTELGPVGFLPEGPGVLRSELDRRGLSVAGSFVFQPLSDPGARDEVLAITRRTCAAIATAGGSHLVVIESVSGPREPTAGRTRDAPRLQGAAWADLVAGVRAVAQIARQHGLRPVVHPHAGTYLEFDDEVALLLAEVPVEELGLCLDTGHAAYAGSDLEDLLRTHGNRLDYLHLKDVRRDVHEDVLARELGFWSAITEGLFCPLGEGVVDFRRVGHVLREVGFDGPTTIEQDRDPRSEGSPEGDVRASVSYLESIGFPVSS